MVEKQQEQDFEIRSPTEGDIAAALKCFRRQGPDIAGQYQNCVAGGERGKVRLYHLVRRSDGALAGFMGFEVNLEPLGEGWAPNAWVSVEYVYLLPEFRGQGLSRFFLARALKRSRWWLTKMAAKYLATGIICMSGSIAASDEGGRFIDQLNRKLRAWCANRQIAFRPEI